MSNEQLLELIRKFEQKKATPDEVDALFAQLKRGVNDEIVDSYLAASLSESEPGSEEAQYWRERLAGKTPVNPNEGLAEKEVRVLHRVYMFSPKFFRYAAAVLLVAGALGYFIFRTTRPLTDDAVLGINSPSSPAMNDIVPGGNKAILTLADGSTIVLDSANSGVLAQQGSARVMKAADGTILYASLQTAGAPVVMYNTMSTPRGGQYQLALPDGTRVWLNAASSITFPTAFTGSERNVSITGEAYFEVAHNTAMPFRVTINDQNHVLVLGTHFNINSYIDETIVRTTLIEGSVKVNSEGQETVLKPGEQARAGGNGLTVLKDVNTDQVIAWKNGAFSFYKDDLRAVLRQISRWYDVEIVYDGQIPERRFSGKMGRDLTLSQVMNFLREVKVNLKLEGKQIIVRKSD